MRHLQDLYLRFRDKGLVVLGFNCADDKEIALEMMRDNGVTFPNVIDSTNAAIRVCFSQYQGRWGSAVPMSYLIDRDGKVLAAWYGGKESHGKALKTLEKADGELAKAIREDRGKN